MTQEELPPLDFAPVAMVVCRTFSGVGNLEGLGDGSLQQVQERSPGGSLRAKPPEGDDVFRK